MSKIKVSLKLFTDTQREFLTESWHLDSEDKKKNLKFSYDYRIGNLPTKMHSSNNQTRQMDLLNNLSVIQILTLTLKALPVLPNLIDLSSFNFRTLDP